MEIKGKYVRGKARELSVLILEYVLPELHVGQLAMIHCCHLHDPESGRNFRLFKRPLAKRKRHTSRGRRKSPALTWMLRISFLTKRWRKPTGSG